MSFHVGAILSLNSSPWSIFSMGGVVLIKLQQLFVYDGIRPLSSELHIVSPVYHLSL